MTVNSTNIVGLKDLNGWFKVTFKSRRDGIGESTVEMLCSDETLRTLSIQIRDALGETPDYSNYPETLRKFMEDEK